MSDQIFFTWNEIEYSIPIGSAGPIIVLPDGTVLQVGCWLESYPPQPAEVTTLRVPFSESSPEILAAAFNAPLAKVVNQLPDQAG